MKVKRLMTALYEKIHTYEKIIENDSYCWKLGDDTMIEWNLIYTVFGWKSL